MSPEAEVAIEKTVLSIRKAVVRASVTAEFAADVQINRDWFADRLVVTLTQSLAAIAGNRKIEVPASWWDHLLLAKPWLRKWAARFGRLPRKTIYRADLLLPDWLRDHPLTKGTTVVPYFHGLQNWNEEPNVE